MKNKKLRIPRKIKKKIPQGVYCYTFTGKTSRVWKEDIEQYVTGYKIKCCPFYFRNKLGHGDCRYLFNQDGILNGEKELDFCLDDQCKSCGIKYE